jgi:hypothetical protein
MQRKQFEINKVDIVSVTEFMKHRNIDHNIIYLLRDYASQNSSNFEYLAYQFAEILSIGINAGKERENKAWHAIESVLASQSSKSKKDDHDFFVSTWQSFSILIPDFELFDRHCSAVKDAYYRFEKYFATQRNKLHTKDPWFIVITNYNWWLKVDEFYNSRHK